MKEFEQEDIEQDEFEQGVEPVDFEQEDVEQNDIEPNTPVGEQPQDEVEGEPDAESSESCEEQVDEHTTESSSQEIETEEDENVSDAYFKQLLSLQAEFDNYRKRTQADVSKAYQNGFNEAITEFLPALDSFKMATDMITDKNTLMGIQYIEKGILAVLEKMGVSVIDTTGEFDPNVHQAIGTDNEADVPSGHIVKECFKGFKMGDKVIRYAQVIVKN